MIQGFDELEAWEELKSTPTPCPVCGKITDQFVTLNVVEQHRCYPCDLLAIAEIPEAS